ncbi:PQQ-binding-like beta-propeller repeat protein [Streptomyces mexicanus]|uniref:outer membrane protein assembly factor BamB family protein n=1 Tax=Streptomyces mexicanus TaxID=178566 RepID=UPI0031ECBE1E
MAGRTDLRRRADARRKTAAERGWEYWDERPDLLERWQEAIVGAVPGRSAARFVVSGTLEGRRVTVFDCVDSAPAPLWSRLPRRTVWTVLLVELPEPLPLIAVSRHGLAVDTTVPLLKRMVGERPDRHLCEIGDPAYDEVHVVETTDPEVARQLLTPTVREFADDRAWLQWRVDGDHLCHVRPAATGPLTDDTAASTAELRSLVRLAEFLDQRSGHEPRPAGRPPARTPTAEAPLRTAPHEQDARPCAMSRGNAARTGVFPEGPPPAGFEAWSVDLGAPVVAEPVACAGTVLVSCADGHCHALDAVTGAPRWRFAADSALKRSPALAWGTVFVVGDDGVLHAIGADDGHQHLQCQPSGSTELLGLTKIAPGGPAANSPYSARANGEHIARYGPERDRTTLRRMWQVLARRAATVPCEAGHVLP